MPKPPPSVHRDCLQVGVAGSGSNLLIADAGVDGLVVKLDKEPSKIERLQHRMLCGGGARLPAVSARAAQAGLTGPELGGRIAEGRRWVRDRFGVILEPEAQAPGRRSLPAGDGQ